MEIAFWASLGLVIYVYAGYPLVLAAWSRVSGRRQPAGPGDLPHVSIVLAVRNEAARLPGRLENLFALDYPPDRIEIVVASDGSSDRTREVVAAYARLGRPLRFLEIGQRGKAAALNAGVAAARHDVLVFADARQRFARDAVRRLVAPLADPEIGGVSGELVLDCEIGATDSTVRDGVGAYWRYEKWLRARESAIDSTLGATGAIYALRRACWHPLPDGTILDDVLAPMRAVLDGWRVVFEPAARAYDVTAPNAVVESRRKTRTLAGNYQLLTLEPRLLVPGVNRVWLQYVSHKIGRLVVPWALFTLLVASLVLAGSSPVYMLAAGAQALFYGMALYGAYLERRGAARAGAVTPGVVNPRRPGVVRRQVERWVTGQQEAQ
jgi:cellulose synthase/poly-beta-1,6-N-acetylglucosamine synthase-like glycosyltransferase